jgi:hypothetical protein
VPVPGPTCRHGQIEAGAANLPPMSVGFAVDRAEIYYANARGVYEADLPAFAPV